MDKTIVIDEFQRLPEDFYDFLHYSKTRSKAKIYLSAQAYMLLKMFYRREARY